MRLLSWSALAAGIIAMDGDVAFAAGRIPAKAKTTIASSGLDEAGMDRSVKPGDDFYAYANGAWLKTNVIRPDRAASGPGIDLDDLSKERVRGILDAAKDDPASLIGRAYRSYLDGATVEARGLEPIKPWLDRIRGLSDRGDYSTLVAEAARVGPGGPFIGFVSFDAKAPDLTIFTMAQGGLGLADRDLYLSENPALAKIREAYVAHLARLLTLVGETDAGARAARVMALETEIAKVHWKREDTANPTRIYNRFSLAETAALSTATVNLPVMLKAISPKITEVIVWQPSAFKGIAEIMDKTPLAVLKDQLILRSLAVFGTVLPEAVSSEVFAFYGTTLAGVPERQPRWRRGVIYTEGVAGDAIGRHYAALYFPPAYKAAMNRLVANMTAAMGARIDRLTWMQPQTKLRAKAKLANFIVKVGYPDRWRDYGGLEVKADDLFGNTVRANRFNFDYQIDKLGKPFPRWEWLYPPQVINAYANFGLLEVVFPAGILQPPFFDPKADSAVNYGAIGAIVAHEVTHHFDNRGAPYNEKGVLADWWTPEDLKAFEAAGQKLVAQYDVYEPLPGQHIKGAFTRSENTGDLGGLAIALDAYHTSLRGKPAPVIGGLSGDQRFFLSWAQAWRIAQREASVRQSLIVDPHSPPKYRVFNVRNLDAWYKAFKVEPGDTLYLPPEQRVRIW